MKWRRVAVMTGVVTVVVFLFAGAVGALHGAPGMASQSVASSVGTGLRGSALTAPNSSCPASGPLGGLNTVETVGILVGTVLAGIVVGMIAMTIIYRRRPALNPQPLPPGTYPTPELNPQPLPPGTYPPKSGMSGGDSST